MGHNWDVFTTDSPYDAVLEGLPTQLALALRRLGFAAPGNLPTFVDEYEGPETDLEQAVSEADTATTFIGVGAVSAYTSGDPKPYLRLFYLLSLPLLELSQQWLQSKRTVLARRWRVKLWRGSVLRRPLTQRCLMRHCQHKTKTERGDLDLQAKSCGVEG